MGWQRQASHVPGSGFTLLMQPGTLLLAMTGLEQLRASKSSAACSVRRQQ